VWSGRYRDFSIPCGADRQQLTLVENYPAFQMRDNP